MKKILLLAVTLLPFLGKSQSQNYIKTTYYKVPTQSSLATPALDQALQYITYYDGLGRPIQKIAAGQAATGKSLIKPLEYDSSGRTTKEYLPFVSQGTDLSYDPNAVSNVMNYPEYQGKTPFGEQLKEASPMGRVLKQAAPGTEWSMDNGKEIKLSYGSNTIGDGVKLYRAMASFNAATGIYDVSLSAGTYDAGQLFKDVIKDEHWASGFNNTTENFIDKEGRVVLKRNYNEGERHDTYYVYDQYGNLSFVFPPMAANPLSQLNEYCFQYKYDSRNRLAEKKLPGKQWAYMVYDKLDRLVAAGPASSPFNGQSSGWMINKYDELGRIAYTGWYQNSGTRKTIQDLVYASGNLWEKRASSTMLDNISIAYTNQAFPASGLKLLSINYYDDYSYPNAPTAFEPVEGVTIFYNLSNKPTGLPTGQWTRVLENASSTSGELTYTLYDYMSRPISIKRTNYMGGYTLTDSRLDFSGKIMYTVTRHKRNTSSQEIKITERYKYTDQDRLLSHTHQIGDNGQEQLLNYNSYDPLGKLVSKKVGGTNISGNTYLQKVDYSYNIRGWLTAINSIDNFATEDGGTDLFALSISYNDISNSPDPAIQPLYNGNISQTSWISRSDSRKRSYSYQYDALNRLRDASYFKDGRNSKSYDESMDYDKNGNILHLKRNGDLDYDSFTIQIDDLDYSYAGNQIKSVKDASGHPGGFRDGADMVDEYKYDGNGNMIADENKEIASISYNHMDLPIEIIFKTGGKINYLYDASGNKLKKIVGSGSKSIATDYLTGFQYVSGKLDFFPTAEGYVKWTEDSYYNYVFNYTDHLGNIRMSYTMDPKEGKLAIMEENHYYPFGMKHEKYNSDKYEYVLNMTGGTYPVGISPLGPTDRKTYQYKYNGKEWQDDMGLNLTAMDFRQYDNMLGRFCSMDLLSELAYDITPYRFSFNNPNYWSDPSGMYEVDDKGNITITDPKEIAMFHNFVSKNPDASLDDMRAFVVNADNGFVLELAEVIIEGVVTKSVTTDGTRVFGVGADSAAGSGVMNGDRGRGSVQADFPGKAGDISMLVSFGYQIASPPLVSLLVFIDIFTPSTFFAGENAQYVGNAGKEPEPAKPEETVVAKRYKYTATDPIRGNPSSTHVGYPKDTIVKLSDFANITTMNIQDSLKAAAISAQKNAEYKKTHY